MKTVNPPKKFAISQWQSDPKAVLSAAEQSKTPIFLEGSGQSEFLVVKVEKMADGDDENQFWRRAQETANFWDESDEIYEKCCKSGAIILVRCPFSDFSGCKIRPAVVFRDPIDDDLIFLPITSKPKTQFEIEIPETEAIDFPKKSFVRIHKIGTIESDLVVKKLGKFTPNFFKKIKSDCLEFLKS